MSSHPDKPAFPPQNGDSLQNSPQGVFQEALPDNFAHAKEVPPAEPVSKPPHPTKAAAKDSNAKPLFLFVEQGPAAGQAFHIVQGSCTIGRDFVVDLCLEHSSVSRRHAQLKRSGDRLYVKDLGSQNGTYVNQQRILDEAEVFAGDAIAIGTSLLKLKDALLFENVPPPVKQPHSKQMKSRRAPYGRLLIASLTASFSTLVSMVLLKLIFQPSTSFSEVEISPVPPEELFAMELPHNLLLSEAALQNPVENVPPPGGASSPSSPISKASILKAFKQGHAENALWQAQTTKHPLLAEQLTAFLEKWETAENLWKEVFKTKSPNTRHALLAHDEALLAAVGISADSSYARELQTRISTLKRMASRKPASPSRVSTPAPPAPPAAKQSAAKQPPAAKRPPLEAPNELNERRRVIDEAFGP